MPLNFKETKNLFSLQNCLMKGSIIIIYDSQGNFISILKVEGTYFYILKKN